MLESKLHLDRLVRLEKLRNLQLLSFCLSLIGVDIAMLQKMQKYSIWTRRRIFGTVYGDI